MLVIALIGREPPLLFLQITKAVSVQAEAIRSIRELIGTKQARSMDLRRNLRVKRKSMVPEKQLCHKRRIPSDYGTKKLGKKRKKKKPKRNDCKHSMFIRKDEIPTAG